MARAGRPTATLGAQGEALIHTHSVARADLFLVVVEPPGPLCDLSFPLDGPELVVGRGSKAHINLNQDDVSRAHAAIRREEDGWVIEDLGSTNGTYLNEARIEKAPLGPESTVRFGRVTAQVVSATSSRLERSRRDFARTNVDPVTGLPGRRAYERKIEELTADEGAPISVGVLLVSVDQLEAINQRCGRAGGDRVLRDCAEALARLEVPGLLCRYDASFVILQDGTDEESAKKLAAEIQRTLGETPITIIEPHKPIAATTATNEATFPVRRALQITASIGISIARLDPGLYRPGLIEYAWHALQDASRCGKVVVERADDATPPAALPLTLTGLKAPFELEAKLKPGMHVMVVGLEDRVSLEAQVPGEMGKIDRALERAAEAVRAEHQEDATGVHDLGALSASAASIELAKSPANDYLIVASRPHIDPQRLFWALETEFERIRSERGLPGAQLICGEPVSEGGIAAAVRCFEERSRDRRLPLPIAWAHRKSRALDASHERFVRLCALHEATTRWLFSSNRSAPQLSRSRESAIRVA
jgi:diguanylate cyclase (GGDEF)-like protein